jgi:branched-chain amino acid transport system substrate-binding protein
VIAVVGPAFSGATKASGGIFKSADLAAVTPSATAIDLSRLGFTTFFRVVPADNVQGEKAAAYIDSVSKQRSLFLVDDKSEAGSGLADVIENSLKRTDVRVTREGVSPTKDYSAVATKLANSGADVVYYAGYYAEAALFARAVANSDYAGIKIGGDGSNDDAFIEGAGDAAGGWRFTCSCVDARIAKSAKGFATAYQTEYGSAPGAFSAEAFDAANTIISVLKGMKDPDRGKVVEALRTVKYQGIIGDIGFEQNGEPKAGNIFVYEVDGGKRTLLGSVDEIVGG